MNIPGELCVEFTEETANRLHHGSSFVRSYRMDGAARDELRRGVQLLGKGNKDEVGNFWAWNKPIARAVLLFARDDLGDIHAVPWVRSPQVLRKAYHIEIAQEFRNFALGKYDDLKLEESTPYPDLIGGVVIPHEGKTIFLGHTALTLSKEHVTAIADSQQVLAEHGVDFHAQAGRNFLGAEMGPPLPA